MLALVTGAGSGIGRELSIALSNKGYDLILVSRNIDNLKETATLLTTNYEIIALDLSVSDNCFKLYEFTKEKNWDIDILINNAGFGLFGEFLKTDLQAELNMIDLNIKSVHILTKLFLHDFIKKDKGYILNTASAAAFFPGPLLSSYYATKSYVLRLTEAIYEELRRQSSNVYIGALCPGPVDTNFNNRAGVKFALHGLKSSYVASYAIDKMFKRKMIIIPGFTLKLLPLFAKLVSTKIILFFCYYFQKRKESR